MNKQLISLLALLSTMIACSTQPISPPQEVQSIETVVGKTPHRHRSHTLAEGIISVDIYKDNQRLHLLTGKHQQGKKTLEYQYSDDGGNHWSKAVKVLNKDNMPIKMGRGRDAQIVALGDTIVTTWVKYVENGPFNTGPMQAARSTDDGRSWQPTTAPPDWKTGPHGFIDMTANGNSFQAVWLDSRHDSGVKGSQGLRYARSVDDGISWQANKTLDAVTCACCWNTLKTDSLGNSYVLYRDKQPSDMSIGVINGNDQWHYLSHVGAFNWPFQGCPHIGGGLAFQNNAGKQRLHSVIGTGKLENIGLYYLYSDNAGKSWSTPRRLGDESSTHADIAADDTGRVVAVWDMMSDNGFAIFTAESLDQGKNWSSPRQLSKVTQRATHPRIVNTQHGFLALWTSSDGHYQSLATRRL